MSQGKVNNADSTWEKIGKKTVNGMHSIVDTVFIIIMVFLLLFAGWAKWDAQQVYTAADPTQYLQYKPSPPYMISFEELQEINPDVLGWLTVYDTNIDYPVVQDKEGNNFYLDHSPKREVEASGSIFLDYRNSPDFSDFNSMIYGHHMAASKMFGDLNYFLEEDFFNEHEYGNLIFDNKNHGLRFIAMLRVDAYDNAIYRPGIVGEESKEEYISHIYENAIYIRGVDVNKLAEATSKKRQEPIKETDRLVLLSTCSEDITNGRLVLVAKMLDHPVENPFPEKEHKITTGIDTTKIVYTIGKLSLTTWIILIILLILILTITLIYLRNRRIANTRRRADERKTTQKTE